MSTPIPSKNKARKPAAPSKASAPKSPKTSAASPAKAPANAPAKVPAPAKPSAPEVAKAAPAAKPVKLAKPREELVRDSFTMPQSDFKLIAQLKERALAAKRAAKKSELLRAGLQALDQLDAKALAAALNRLEPIKTGRPKKGH